MFHAKGDVIGQMVIMEKADLWNKQREFKANMNVSLKNKLD